MLDQRSTDGLDWARRFIRLCLQTRWDSQALEEALALSHETPQHWDAVCEIAACDHVESLLLQAVRGHSLVPEELEIEWQQTYYQHATRNALLWRELGAQLCLLSAAGIPVVLLKGASLAERVYGNIALRPMVDLDLLVQRAQVPAALRALEEHGYYRYEAEAHPGATLSYENEVVLCRPGVVDTFLEIHWSLIDSPYYQRILTMDWFWETSIPGRVGDVAALALGVEAQVLHLCAHLHLHHQGAGLLWWQDVAETLVLHRQEVDWDQLLARAETNQLLIPLQRTLLPLAQAWRVPIPVEATRRLAMLRPSAGESKIHSDLSSPHRPVALRLWQDLESMLDWRQRIGYACRSLFPTPAYMRERYRIGRRFMLPLYYPVRWYIGLRSLFRRAARPL